MRFRSFLKVLLVLPFMCAPVTAATITVDDDGPADCNSISVAVSLAVEGDVIIVKDGVYNGSENHNILLEKSISLLSENGPTSCIIDCQSEAECFAFKIIGCDPVIEGFTITQCSNVIAEPAPDESVAIFITSSSALIRNCIFTGNAACIYCIPGGDELGPEPVSHVINCTFYGNSGGEAQGAVGMWTNSHYGGSLNVRNSLFQNNEPNEIDFDFHLCKSGFHPGMSVEFTMLEATWQDEYLLTFENCTYGQDPLFADPNNGDFHVKSQTGRWDPNALAWVTDGVMSPAIDAGDPNDGEWALEPSPNAKRINAGAYGGTPQASMSELLCHSELASCYDDWVAFGKPDCWCFQYQCRGDADGIAQGSSKCGYTRIYTGDLSILASAWNIKEPPHGPGISGTDICADFDHAAQGSDKTGYVRVYTKDLSILSTYWNIKQPPLGPGFPDCPLYPAGCLNYYTEPAP